MSKIDFILLKAIDFCDDVRDGTHDSPKHVNSGKLLITSKNIKGDSIDFDNASYISEEDYNKINKRSLVETNDVLYSMIGTIGLVYRVDKKPNYAIKNIGLFKIKDEIKSKWLYYYLNSLKAKEKVLSMLSGSTQKFISLSNLRNLEIEYPKNDDDAKKIIKICESIDNKIRINNEINNNLYELQKQYFKKLFNNDLYSVQKLGDMFDITAGGDAPKDKFDYKTDDYKYPIISNGIDNEGIYGYCKDYKIDKKSVTISARGTIGYKVLRNYSYYPIVRLISLIPKDDNISSEYLFYALDHIKILGTGTTQQQLTVPMVKDIKIKVYDKETIKIFTNFSSKLNEKIANNKEENKNLEQLRDTLLPKLMNGEINLDNVEI